MKRFRFRQRFFRLRVIPDFIKKIFEDKDVLISRLSYGIPMGADIDYMDVVTLDKALDDRKKISD